MIRPSTAASGAGTSRSAASGTAASAAAISGVRNTFCVSFCFILSVLLCREIQKTIFAAVNVIRT